MVRSTFLFARLRSAGGVYLSGGLKPATETGRILFYPPLVKAGVYPTEINRLYSVGSFERNDLWGGDRERPDTARTRSVLEYGTHKVWNTGSFSILFLLYIVGCIHGKVNSMVSVLADIHVKNAAAPYQ